MTKSNRRAKRKRQDRAARTMEQAIEESQGNGPSEGMYAVINFATGERTKGLNYNQATKLWETCGTAIILKDEHVRRSDLGGDAC